MKHYFTAEIPLEYEGRKLLSYLKSELAFSAAKISSVKYDTEGLFVNERRVTVREILHRGDRIRVLLTDSERRENRLIPFEMPLDILYEDEHFIAVNKTAGTVCHPAKGHLLDSLASGLRFYFDRTDPDQRVHLLGRLDKETSGVVLCAKNAAALELLKKSNTAEKTYIAAASGKFAEKEGRITIPIKYVRDRELGILRVERGEEKPAETEYRVIGEGTDFSVLEVKIGTGRMHQIRFHLSEEGHPLLGDSLYGGPMQRIGRTALHAWKLRFCHPFTKQEITFQAGLPADMRELLPDAVPAEGRSRGSLY